MASTTSGTGAERDHPYVTLGMPVELEARWSQLHRVVAVTGSYGTYPALSMHMSAEQAATFAADLITTVLESTPDGLPDRLLAAMSTAIEYHWRDVLTGETAVVSR